MCLQSRGWAPSIPGTRGDIARFLLAVAAEDVFKLVLAAPWGVSRDLRGFVWAVRRGLYPFPPTKK